MINNLVKTLREKFVTPSDRKGEAISFLKYNTPLSGTGIGTKVLLFVFLGEDTHPMYVVKTVRSGRDKDVIIHGFERLTKIHEMTKGTDFHNLFPKPLYVSDSETPWSIETYCEGRRAQYPQDVPQIIDTYTRLSNFLAQNASKKNSFNFEYAKSLILELHGDDRELDTLIVYAQKLIMDKVYVLPATPQHGDLTIDNVIFLEKNIHVIDADTFGVIDIPGYDIFHFYSIRKNPQLLEDALTKYFKALEIDTAYDRGLLFIYYLHELRIKKDYIVKNLGAKVIIEKFEEMVVSS